MAIVNSVNNTTPTSTEAPKLSGVASKKGRIPVPPSGLAEQAIATSMTAATSPPVTSRHISSLTPTTHESAPSTLKVAAKKSFIVELEENVENLSQTAQDLFADALTKFESIVAGLLATFNSTNKEYDQNEAILDQDPVRERFKKKLKENEDRYMNMRYNEALLERRVKCLHKTIMKLFIEFGLLQHSIIGNNSLYQSLTRYGAEYRLWEMGTPESTDEKTSLSTKDDSKESTSTTTTKSITSSTVAILAEQTTSKQVDKEILLDLVSLKERVKICFEALKLTIYPSFTLKKEMIINDPIFQQEIRRDIAASDFPKKYYSFYNNQFKALIERINLAIGLRSKPREIVERQNQLAKILSEMQAHFKLIIPVEEATSPSVEETLTPECNRALHLAARITSLKEEYRLVKSDNLVGTHWDSRESLLKQAAALKKEVAAFKTGDMDQRLTVIHQAVQTYKVYMDSIRRKMIDISVLFQKLNEAYRVRRTWKLDSLKDTPKEVSSTAPTLQEAMSSSSTSSSNSWFSFFSWGTPSPAPAITAATTTSSNITTAIPAEASIIATTTGSTNNSNPVTINSPSIASAVTTTTSASTSTTSTASASST